MPFVPMSLARNRFQDGVAYQEAVQYAMDNTDSKDTLIVSTADHGHSIAFNGFCGRGSPVTGVCMEIDPLATEHTGVPNLASDGLPYTAVSAGNGLGSIFYVSNSNRDKTLIACAAIAALLSGEERKRVRLSCGARCCTWVSSFLFCSKQNVCAQNNTSLRF